MYFGSPSHRIWQIKERMTGEKRSALISTPLTSTIDDQIKEAEGLGLRATMLAVARLEVVSTGKFQLQ